MATLPRTLLTAAFAVTCTASAFGQNIQYGDRTGSTVDYTNIFEGPGVELYGAPIITGDTLVFTPSADFRAESDNGAGSGITTLDGFLSFTVDARNGEALTTVTLEESGAYSLIAAQPGGGTAATRVGVSAIFSINVLEVDGVAFEGESQRGQGIALFNAALPGDETFGDFWSGTAVVDIAEAVAGLNLTGDVTRATVVLDNRLVAISEDGTQAFIDKKNLDLQITVPEPATAGVLALAGVGLLTGRRRLA